MTFTGKEIEIGQSPFDLAEYAKDASTTQKLYISESKDMYVEVSVKSKQMEDENSKRQAAGMNSQQTIRASEISKQQSIVGETPPGPPKNKNEPETEEDKLLMDDFIRKEEEYKKQI